MEDEVYLVHHGVKGMKWGIRKKRVSTSSSRIKKATPTKKSSTKPSNVKTKVKRGAGITAALLGGHVAGVNAAAFASWQAAAASGVIGAAAFPATVASLPITALIGAGVAAGGIATALSTKKSKKKKTKK